MQMEIAANRLYKMCQLALVAVKISHLISQYATKFLPSEVGILKFRAAHLRSQNGKEYRKERFMHVFRRLKAAI